MKIYFAGSIRGGRYKQNDYFQIISILKKFGEVLTEHVGCDNLTGEGELYLDDSVIYERDVAWLEKADVLVADVSVPSIGVGFEIGKALADNKKILCVYDEESEKKISPMVSGCERIKTILYKDMKSLEKNLTNYLQS